MKRILALVVTILLLSTCAMAEEIDLTGMDLASLLELHTKVDAAVQDKIDCLVDDNLIFQGVYVVGKDITAGYYLFTCVVDQYDSGNFDFFYEIYDTEDTYTAHKRSMFDRFNVGESVQLRLEDGMVLRIVNGTANVKPVEKPSWAP